MRTSKGCLLRACYSWGINHHHLCFGRGSKLGRRVKSFTGGKRGGFGDALIGGFWLGKVEGGLNRSRTFYVTGCRAHLTFSHCF